MSQATEASVSAILKEVYPGAVEDELNNEIALYAVLEKEKVTVDGQGKRIVRPFRLNRNQGFGARSDTDLLPQAGSQTLQNAQINMSTNYMVGQITGRVIRTSYSNDAAFENALAEEIEFGLTDFANEIGRQLYNGAGQLTKVNGAVSAATAVVVNSTQYLAVGMTVEFWNGSTNQTTNDAGLPTGQTGTVITAIDNATNTITVTTAQTITSGATVARAGNNTSATVTKELNGLDTTIDDGTDYSGLNYFGVNRATYPVLYGNRTDAAGTLSETLLQTAYDNARQIGGGIIDAIFTDYGTRRAYTSLLTSLKRYPLEGIQSPQFAGGIKVSQDLRTQLGEGLSFSGASVIPSRLSIPKKAFLLDTKSWHLYQQSEVEWVMNGDSILTPLVSIGYDAYKFVMFYDAQLYSEAPNRNAKVVNTY
ncbi:MAG TPA: phage major capsid protein [Dongiaceae bacterium]|nr:phage major capsid protein [Dongiaceae bacterium]